METQREKYSLPDNEKIGMLVEKYKKLWDEEYEEIKKQGKKYDSRRNKKVFKQPQWSFYRRAITEMWPTLDPKDEAKYQKARCFLCRDRNIFVCKEGHYRDFGRA